MSWPAVCEAPISHSRCIWSAEMHCTARLRETWQEKPTIIVLGRQGQRLIENHFPKWATVTMCLGHAEQAFASDRAACQVAGEDGLMRSWIAICEQDRARPGEGQANGQGGGAR